jgi:hypothetical protein
LLILSIGKFINNKNKLVLNINNREKSMEKSDQQLEYTLFLDESGDLGIYGTKYFIISAIIIDNKEFIKLKKILKKIRNKSDLLKKSKEMKAIKMSNDLKKQILMRTNDINYEIHSIVMNKKKFNNKSFLINSNANFVYMDIVNELFNNKSFRKCQSFKLDNFVVKNLENIFQEKLIKNLGDEKDICLYFLDSSLTKGIQFVDLISWSIFQKIENNNSEFVKMIKNKLNIKYYDKKF